MSERPLLDCSVATCKKIRCRIASLEMHQPLEFMIKGNISFQWVSQTQQQKVSLVSEARIEYEEKKYTQKEGFVQRQVQTVVERFVGYNYLPIIVGSSVGGLVLLVLITAALCKVTRLLPAPVQADDGGRCGGRGAWPDPEHNRWQPPCFRCPKTVAPQAPTPPGFASLLVALDPPPPPCVCRPQEAERPATAHPPTNKRDPSANSS
ncbi:integrin alpha-X-like isoform X1 [Chelonia mydas]|uniref:integrin alpha-X-like isoform X1 n=1 Tax=Chelonia mydas TaxID=8469 RepID=UPI001CA8AAF3|nr:integrin alpha-X-like isoform X1 [Chelonia mydas]